MESSPPPFPSSPPPFSDQQHLKKDSTNFDVFISYNREYDQEVKTLYYELTVTHELNVWLDEFEDMPTSLSDDNSKGIRYAKVFLCCCSKKYCETSFCTDEFMMAKKLKKKIIFLMLEKMNEFELGRMSPFAKQFLQIHVFEYEKKLLELSKSDLYDSIINIIRLRLNEPDEILEEVSKNVIYYKIKA